MKRILILILAAVVCGYAAANQERDDLSGVDSVEVWDHRGSDLPAAPVKVDDPEAVSTLVHAIQEAPGQWRHGSFTSPSVILRFVFFKGTGVIATIELGDGFLVRGGGGDWAFKRISKELQASLVSLGRKKGGATPAQRP